MGPRIRILTLDYESICLLRIWANSGPAKLVVAPGLNQVRYALDPRERGMEGERVRRQATRRGRSSLGIALPGRSSRHGGQMLASERGGGWENSMVRCDWLILICDGKLAGGQRSESAATFAAGGDGMGSVLDAD